MTFRLKCNNMHPYHYTVFTEMVSALTEYYDIVVSIVLWLVDFAAIDSIYIYVLYITQNEILLPDL